jgi:hypothetical protein
MTIQDIVNFTNADSIADIAFDKLGDVTKFRELADFNGLDIFQQLPIGSEIKIPTPAELESIAREKLRSELGKLTSSLDLSKIAAGRIGGVDINEAIKLVDWLY